MVHFHFFKIHLWPSDFRLFQHFLKHWARTWSKILPLAIETFHFWGSDTKSIKCPFESIGPRGRNFFCELRSDWPPFFSWVWKAISSENEILDFQSNQSSVIFRTNTIFDYQLTFFLRRMSIEKPKLQRYYTPNEVSKHAFWDDCWVSWLGKGLFASKGKDLIFQFMTWLLWFKNIFKLVMKSIGSYLSMELDSELCKPLIEAAGTDISHWFDSQTGQVCFDSQNLVMR